MFADPAPQTQNLGGPIWALGERFDQADTQYAGSCCVRPLRRREFRVMRLPVEAFSRPPAMVEGITRPASSGPLGGLEVLEAHACPWPVSSLSSARADPNNTDPTKAQPDVLRPTWDIVEEWGDQSFPASDPPANW